MSVSLQKGQKVSLSKDNQGLAQVIVGLGWDEVKRKGGLFSRIQLELYCYAFVIFLKNVNLFVNLYLSILEIFVIKVMQ